MSNGKRGGQLGNTNAANAKLWNAAIHRALDAKTKLDGKEALDALALKLIEKCESGDMSALKEFGDRIEGKPAQSVTLLGDEDNPLVTKIVREII